MMSTTHTHVATGLKVNRLKVNIRYTELHSSYEMQYKVLQVVVFAYAFAFAAIEPA